MENNFLFGKFQLPHLVVSCRGKNELLIPSLDVQTSNFIFCRNLQNPYNQGKD